MLHLPLLQLQHHHCHQLLQLLLPGADANVVAAERQRPRQMPRGSQALGFAQSSSCNRRCHQCSTGPPNPAFSSSTTTSCSIQALGDCDEGEGQHLDLLPAVGWRGRGDTTFRRKEPECLSEWTTCLSFRLQTPNWTLSFLQKVLWTLQRTRWMRLWTSERDVPIWTVWVCYLHRKSSSEQSNVALIFL